MLAPLVPQAGIDGAASRAAATRADAASRSDASARSEAATRTQAPARVDAQARTPAATAATPAARTPLQRGLSHWDHGVQTRVAGAQQALDFLDRSSGALHALKSEVAATLGGRSDRGAQLDARLRQARELWQQRARVSGGTLDSALGFDDGAPATQRFSVPGLTLARLRAGVKETLTFATGNGQPLRAVTLDAGLPDAELIQRLDHALAPSQLRLAAGADGALMLSTPEANFANVRDALAIQGGGTRFPAGQLHRVAVEAAPSAIAPEQWRTDDTAALRQTLGKLTQAVSAVSAARSRVQDTLTAASDAAAAPADSADAMTALANQFATGAAAPGYAPLLAVKPALAGVTRERTTALLRLR